MSEQVIDQMKQYVGAAATHHVTAAMESGADIPTIQHRMLCIGALIGSQMLSGRSVDGVLNWIECNLDNFDEACKQMKAESDAELKHALRQVMREMLTKLTDGDN